MIMFSHLLFSEADNHDDDKRMMMVMIRIRRITVMMAMFIFSQARATQLFGVQ